MSSLRIHKSSTRYTVFTLMNNVLCHLPLLNCWCGNWTTRGYANLRTGHLADWSSRGLDNSRTSQLADWTSRGLDNSRSCRCRQRGKLSTQSRRWHPRVSSPRLVQYASCLVRELTSPRVVQSASWRIRELSSNRWCFHLDVYSWKSY